MHSMEKGRAMRIVVIDFSRLICTHEMSEAKGKKLLQWLNKGFYPTLNPKLYTGWMILCMDQNGLISFTILLTDFSPFFVGDWGKN